MALTSVPAIYVVVPFIINISEIATGRIAPTRKETTGRDIVGWSGANRLSVCTRLKEVCRSVRDELRTDYNLSQPKYDSGLGNSNIGPIQSGWIV